jgi:hypothetical protein
MKKSEEIYFRSSGVGALLEKGRNAELTDNQKELLEKYQNIIDGNVAAALTEKQTETLQGLLARKNGEGKPLTPTQEQLMVDYKKVFNGEVLVTLTPSQKEVYSDLFARKNAPPELSDTAKLFIKKTWLLNEKGFYENLNNKFVEKGLMNEEDAFELLGEVEDDYFSKNVERIYKNNLTGECDNLHTKEGRKIIKDVKNSWNPMTFMNATASTLYEWQGRAYMHLYDADEFHLQFVLTDTPEHLVLNEKKKLWYKYFNENMTIEETEAMEEKLQPFYEQIERNLVFTTNPAYNQEERVKTFVIYRDLEKEQQLLDAIPMALEYYKGLTLNSKK